jgi:hypothetical protein
VVTAHATSSPIATCAGGVVAVHFTGAGVTLLPLPPDPRRVPSGPPQQYGTLFVVSPHVSPRPAHTRCHAKPPAGGTGVLPPAPPTPTPY